MVKLRNILQNILNESEMLFMEDVTKESCDCCKYFDFTFSQAGGNFGGLNHPLYYEFDKGERNEIKYISPKSYMTSIARGFGMSYDRAMESGVINWDTVKKYAKDMKNGDKFPIGWYDSGRGAQEGRHRALAAMELGCENIPVVVITQVHSYEVERIATEYKDLPRETVDRIYKEKGYHGISDLDWRTLRRFVEYKL